jgi:hypothetical protein
MGLLANPTRLSSFKENRMTIQFEDFFPGIKSKGFWSTTKYASVSETLAQANRWVTHNRIEVLNIETVVLPVVSSSSAKGAIVTLQQANWCQIIRIWHSTSVESEAVTGWQDYFIDLHDLDNIIFPVITMAPNGYIEVIQSAQEFRQCSQGALEDRYFDQLQLFDSASQKFVVHSCRKELDLAAIDGVKTVAVSFSMSVPQPIGLSEVKELTSPYFDRKQSRLEVKQQQDFRSLCHFLTANMTK